MIKPMLQPIIEYVRTTDKQEFRENFTVAFGNSGPREYYFRLVGLVREKFSNWIPDGYEDYVHRLSQDQVNKADAQVRWIQENVQRFIINSLKERLGEKFFDVGVPKQVYQRAHEKRGEDPAESRMPAENYLDFVDLKKIVENKDVWPLFEKALNIKLPEEAKGRTKYLSWMDRINEVRRVSAHPHGRTYQEDDIALLNYVEEELQSRLSVKTV